MAEYGAPPGPTRQRSNGSFNNVWAKPQAAGWQQGNVAEVDDRPVIGAEVDCTVMAGRNLVAKDRSLFGKKSSDPFVVLSCRGKTLGTTKVVKKNLSPEWNQPFKLNIDGKAAAQMDTAELVVAIFDEDKLSANDPMGEVRIPLKSLAGGHVRDQWFDVQNCKGCSDASGQVQLKVSMVLRHALCLHRQDTMQITAPTVAVGLGWDPLPGGKAIDLDNTCGGAPWRRRLRTSMHNAPCLPPDPSSPIPSHMRYAGACASATRGR